MSNVKKAILQKKIEGVVYDLMVKTNADNTIVGDGRTLTAYLADLITSSDIDAKIQELIGTAPETLDTLGEIAEKLQDNDDLHDLIQSALTDKVDKVTGMRLSSNDFTDVLKTKLEGLSNYIHPSSHSAAMITETTDRQFITATQKTKINESGRILVGTSTPSNLTDQDLFLQIVE